MRARSVPIRSSRTKCESISSDEQPMLVGCEVELEIRGEEPQFAQGAGLELADALARDPEPRPHFLEGLRIGAREAEAQLEHVAHARVQALQRVGELLVAEVERRLLVGTVALRVLDQVAVERFAVADGRLEADRILDEVEQLLDALFGESALV